MAGNYLADRWANKKIAILHDNTTYGKGLAERDRKAVEQTGRNQKQFTKRMYRGKNDYLAESAAYAGRGYRRAVWWVAIIRKSPSWPGRPAIAATVRSVRRGRCLATEELDLIAGPAAEGIVFTFVADPRQSTKAAPVAERFRAQSFEPAGATRC